MRARLAAAGVPFSLPLAPVERDVRLARDAAMMRRVEDEDDEAVAAALAAAEVVGTAEDGRAAVSVSNQ